MKIEPPSSFNQHIFFEAKSVFYGTDDGYQDGSCTEFQLYEDFYRSVTSERREKIHLVSAVGGLYRLNLISLWRPREIPFLTSIHTRPLILSSFARCSASARASKTFSIGSAIRITTSIILQKS